MKENFEVHNICYSQSLIPCSSDSQDLLTLCRLVATNMDKEKGWIRQSTEPVMIRREGFSNMKTINRDVFLKVDIKQETAKEVAYEVLKRANPHDQTLVDNKLNDAGITHEQLEKYFVELGKIVAEFWYSNSSYGLGYRTALKPHEVRSLYLPLIYSVIFASVGNMKYGNYNYVLKPVDQESIDKEFVFEFSAKLESMRAYVTGADGQIGNRSAQPQTSVMLSIVTEFDNVSANILVRDGVQVDNALAGFAALLGLALVESSYSVLYTGEDQINFRELANTITQSEWKDKD